METTILGAGALGLTLALRLALQGDHVTVIERESHPGGLAAGFAVGDVTLEKFYHHLFRSDHAILELIEELDLGKDMQWRAPDTSMLIHNQPHTLNSVMSTLRFAPLPMWDRVRMGAVIGYLKFWPNYQSLERKKASQWLPKWMGRKAYATVWGPQMVGKFGAYAPDISLAWFWSRIHCRTTELGYLHGGFQRLYDRLAQVVETLGGKIQFETSATAIKQEKNKRLCVTTTKGDIHSDRIISTLPTRLTLKLLPTMPAFQRRYEWGNALGAHCLILALDRQLMERVYWLSVCDPDYPFLAMVEHTNFMSPDDYGGRHLVYLGNYLPMNHPLFAQSKEEVLAAFTPAIKRINPNFSPEWVQESWMFSAPFAQPVVTPEFHDHIPPHETPIPGVYMANMFQVYPQDRGQNYAVDMANWLAKHLAAKDA